VFYRIQLFFMEPYRSIPRFVSFPPFSNLLFFFLCTANPRGINFQTPLFLILSGYTHIGMEGLSEYNPMKQCAPPLVSASNIPLAWNCMDGTSRHRIFMEGEVQTQSNFYCCIILNKEEKLPQKKYAIKDRECVIRKKFLLGKELYDRKKKRGWTQGWDSMPWVEDRIRDPGNRGIHLYDSKKKKKIGSGLGLWPVTSIAGRCSGL